MKVLYFIGLMVAVVSLSAIHAPLYASRMDDRIESSARKSYIFQTYLTGDDIKIESRDGVVTLTGMIGAEFHKSLAQETVAGLPGVKSVDNRLEVKGAPPTANSDAWLSEKVRTTLLFHRSVKTGKIEVFVQEGIVTLRGKAVSQIKKDLTTEYAKDVEGVKDVKNEMTVSKPSKKTQGLDKKIDDASTTAQVKMTLLFHSSTSTLTPKVVTNNGLVTLYGQAGSTAEKNLVTKIVNDVNGVKRVNNRMTVE
jgi:hyperosmotically inducible periplasmic protein